MAISESAARLIRMRWAAKPCDHPAAVPLETDGGADTGDEVCLECGEDRPKGSLQSGKA